MTIVRCFPPRRHVILDETSTRRSRLQMLNNVYIISKIGWNVRSQDLLVVFLANSAHQFPDAILFQWSMFALQRKYQIVILRRMEHNQLITTRAYAYGG